jgi:hypothetical protein
MRWDGVDWNELAHDTDKCMAFVDTVMNVGIPHNAGKFLSICTIDSYSRRDQLLN